MTILFDSYTINKVVEQLYPARTFLKQTFFPNEQTFSTKYIEWDKIKTTRKLAPFVSSISKAKDMTKTGYTKNIVEAPYINMSVNVTNIDLLSRKAGDGFQGSGKSPYEQAEEMLAKELLDLENKVERRCEWMASKALQSGSVVLDGDFSGKEINYGSVATLTPGALWSVSTSDPIDDLGDWCLQLQESSGYIPDICIMSPSVVQYFIKNETVKELMDLLKLRIGEINVAQLGNGVSFLGTLNVGGSILDIYSYVEWYTTDAGVSTPMIPNGKVILGSKSASIENYFGYGAIQDLEYPDPISTKFWVKSWTEKNPSVRFLGMQSAPLPIFTIPDAFGVATVLS